MHASKQDFTLLVNTKMLMMENNLTIYYFSNKYINYVYFTANTELENVFSSFNLSNKNPLNGFETQGKSQLSTAPHQI